MNTLIWLLKVNIAITFLYAFYKLFFQKDTFFNVKRMALLSFIFFSLFYPFFDVKELFLSKTSLLNGNSVVFELPELFVFPGTGQMPQTMSIINVISVIWITGVIVLLLYFVFQIISILSKIFISKRMQLCGVSVFVLKDLKTPFSFFNYILINPEFHDEQELSEILHHEKTHVEGRHTLDVILSELFCILCWFNPFAWLMKKEIRMNLEFLADNFVMKSVKNTEHYQLHLLRLSYHKAIAQLSNNFNVSPLKKRIQMMNKKKSPNVGIIKYILFVPLFAILLFVNNLQAQNVVKETKNLDEKVFSSVDEMPQFPGGEREMFNYLSQNLKYPDEAQKQKIQGMVVVSFVVKASGEITDATILRSLESSCDEEAIRVVNAMPRWIPGKQNGEAVNVEFKLPITFFLAD